MSYAELLSGQKVAGKRVAVIGAGGIGFDVSEYLTSTHVKPFEKDAQGKVIYQPIRKA